VVEPRSPLSCFAAVGRYLAIKMEISELVRIGLPVLLLNSPVYFLFGWWLFGNWESFTDALLLGHDYDRAKLAIWFLLPIGLIRFELWLVGL